MQYIVRRARGHRLRRAHVRMLRRATREAKSTIFPRHKGVVEFPPAVSSGLEGDMAVLTPATEAAHLLTSTGHPQLLSPLTSDRTIVIPAKTAAFTAEVGQANLVHARAVDYLHL
ncbi:hypothetical protein NUW54_g1314 [Trametes sanguinea]|uniref:Uncharacterized protein n=1 Tax=Trametes sanguinea TaxID=158606 RepID=A0ACC1Q8F7_9APHY|nr:hypothetical protein NUW54_g1314 [Trametes sanguinea]